jgi:GNAT superfamily N-acetyltransferase
MLDCIVAAFGPWPAIDIDVSPLDHLRWKLGPEIDGRRYHIIAEDSGRIVACGLARPLRAKLRDAIVAACLYGDMAVLPEFQNQGLMGRVWDHQDEVGQRFALSIGLSGNEYVEREYLGRPRSQPFANKLQLLELEVAAGAGKESDSRAAAVAVSEFDERVDSLWAAASRSFSFAVVRDRAWLNYRYANSRAGRFTIVIAQEAGSLLGYVVLTEARGKGFIADLLASPDRPDATAALLLAARTHFASRGVGHIRSWLNERHPYRQGYLDYGFRPVRDVRGLKVGAFRPTDLSFLFEDADAAIHYMAGDSDLV